MQFRNHQLTQLNECVVKKQLAVTNIREAQRMSSIERTFHSDNQTYLRSFQQQIYEIFITPRPFLRSRKSLMD